LLAYFCTDVALPSKKTTYCTLFTLKNAEDEMKINPCCRVKVSPAAWIR
jgi:hypothetical protein